MLQNQTISAIASTLRAFDPISDTLDILIISFAFYHLIQFARKSLPGQLALVIFQPDLRRTLERMGQTTVWAGRLFGNRRADPSLRGVWQSAVVAICDAAEQLSDTRTGALMVLERNNNLDEIIRTGTPMHAD